MLVMFWYTDKRGKLVCRWVDIPSDAKKKR
jgi:hypothetical protein